MKELFSLGELYPSDFLHSNQQPRSGKIELKLLLDDNGAVRLEKTAPYETMWGKYWYRSSINQTMTNELKSIVASITDIYQLEKGDLWIDIASNDGCLLSFVSKHPKKLLKVGIDPADDTYKQEAEKYADLIIQNYFSSSVFQASKYGKNKAKIITSIAMFYDLEQPEVFIRDIDQVLDDDGLWVLQLSYTPLMLKQLAFDNILHEHFYYYSLFNIKSLLEKKGFKIMYCRLNDINGGSFRLYVMKRGGNEKLFGSQPHRDICQFRVNSLLSYEGTLKLNATETWMDFFRRIEELKITTVSFIRQERAKGKSIWAYGASSKGNTLLQYFGLNHSLIDGIAERSHYKYGLRTVGTNIPIYSEKEMRQKHPDYLIILPWHFINEFRLREADFLNRGGRFIVPCPQFEIISDHKKE